MGGLGSVDDLFPWNVFLLAGCKELEQFDLLFSIKLGSESAGSDKLKVKLMSY